MKYIKILAIACVCCTLTACSSCNTSVSVQTPENKSLAITKDNGVDTPDGGKLYELPDHKSLDNIDYIEHFEFNNEKPLVYINSKGEEVYLPATETETFNYDEYVEFLAQYELETKFTDKDKTYFVIKSEDPSIVPYRILGVIEGKDRSEVYYTGDSPCETDFNVQLITVQVDNPNTKLVISNEKEFGELIETLNK